MLKDYFSQEGTVVSAKVVTDKYSGRSRGFGFVEMSTEEEAEKVKQKLNGATFDGRTITVNDARPQVPREERGNFKPQYQDRGRGRRGR